MKTLKLADCTGKLNSHGEYIKCLKKLESRCKFIEYVLVDEDDKIFAEKFEDLVLSSKLTNKWWGTKSSQKSKLYRLKSSAEIFKYLARFETFCKFTVSDDKGGIAENTDFGINDIAFFDDNELPLLFTTTHEGFITVREDL